MSLGRRAPAPVRTRAASWRARRRGCPVAAVERAVQDIEPASAERLDREPVGDPRREAEHTLNARVVGDRDRDGTAHREAEQERALGAELVDRRACIVDAHVEAVPRLDPVPDLAEASCGKRGASRPTSHSSDALHVPSTAADRPPFTHTTAGPCSCPRTRMSAPLASRTFRVTYRRLDVAAAKQHCRDRERGRRVGAEDPEARSRARVGAAMAGA